MRTRWWHWLLGTYLIIAIWFLGSTFFYDASNLLLGSGETWQQLARELSTFIPFFIATPLIWRYIIKRDVALLINVSGRVNMRRIATGFAVWFGISALSSLIDYVLHPNSYRWSFSLAAFIPYALVIVLLLPLQTSAEEFFFRGWILQWAQRWSMHTKVVLGGLLFALPHLGNPEAAGHELPALTAWFILGAGWSFVTLRDGGIELALGAHFANNLFSLMVVGYDGAALPTSALLTTSQLNIEGTAVVLVFAMALFVAFTRQK